MNIEMFPAFLNKPLNDSVLSRVCAAKPAANDDFTLDSHVASALGLTDATQRLLSRLASEDAGVAKLLNEWKQTSRLVAQATLKRVA